MLPTSSLCGILPLHPFFQEATPSPDGVGHLFLTAYDYEHPTCFLKGLTMGHGRTTSLTLTLTPEERQTLLAWQRSTTIPAGRARRGRIILLLADGVPIAHIADTVGINRRFVYKWAKRFLHERIAGLTDLPGRGTWRQAARAMGTAAFQHNGQDTCSVS